MGVSPQVPYLAAGATAIAGGWAREGGWPKNGTGAVAATAVLVLITSLTAGTGMERVVTALGWLLFGAAVYSAVPAFTTKGKA